MQLLKPGGWLIFDDVENDRKKVDHVRSGLAMFLERHPMEMVLKDKYIEVYRRIGEAPEETEEPEDREESEEEPAVVTKLSEPSDVGTKQLPVLVRTQAQHFVAEII